MMLTQLQRFTVAAILIAMAGCSDYRNPLDPVTQSPFEPDAMHRYYRPMIRNAAAYDRSLAEIHFVPHTSRLNDLGARRLDLLSGILEEYGGTVRYETDSPDEDQADQRLDEIKRYLADIGVDTDQIEVTAMMSGGRGMSADKALQAAVKAEQSEFDTSSSILTK